MSFRIFQNKLHHKTKKFGIDIFYKSGFIDVKDIIINKQKFSKMCRQGCGVYGRCWACPPYSPSLSAIKNKFKKMFVFISYIYTEQIKIKSPYLVLFNIYNILAPKMHKQGMILEKQLNGLLLKSGPCRVCKNCSAAHNKPCRFPEKKRYALESIGIDVQKLAALLKHKLLWYDRKCLPEYTSVVCGVLTNKKPLQRKIRPESIIRLMFK
ncbi:DUF2284 domain-containing protein [archaeon]|nr:DUF2284 domain-containing protein [archaeon]